MLETGQDAVREEAHAARMPHRKYAYFRDDQIVFVVKHQETLTLDHQIAKYEKFTAIINQALKELYGDNEHHPPTENPPPEPPPLRRAPRIFRQARPPQVIGPPQVIAFPRLTAEEQGRVMQLVADNHLTREEAQEITDAFSIAIYDVNDVPPHPASLITIVEELHPELSRLLESDPIEDFMPQGTLLNWLTSVASQSGGTGGPGGRPFPYIGNRKTAPYRLSVKRQLKEKGIYGNGKDVDVVILDTAPCAQDLVAAYKELPDHPLVPTLLGPAGRLHLYPATYRDQLRMSCTSLNAHDYRMTDHGLFIAGLIHSVVPRAKIHLIEVLNPYGVGDFWSFVKGLLTIFEQIYDLSRNMVVNCSWMLEFPFDILQSRDKDDEEDPDDEFAKIVQEYAQTSEAMLLRALKFMFNRLYGLGRQAVAAAGNDSRKEDENVKARYPAALRRVAGVGSLPNTRQKRGNGKFMASAFSNLSDTPERNGIATFGGEVGEGKGVLGLYIGEIPCCCNESKWAWWSGTSFATAILTAAIASVLSSPNGSDRTPVALDKLYTATDILASATGAPAGAGDSETKGKKIIQNSMVRQQEDAFLVIQN